MKKTPLILALILTSSLVFAFDEWTKEDTYREVAWQTLNLIDWKQTLIIANNPDHYKEINPIIGEHPSRGKVNTYMAVGAVSHLAMSYVLPKEYRVIFQYFTIGTSAYCVGNNISIGLQLGF